MSADSDDGAPVVVHLPRSLVALFTGAARRMVARGATVGDVIHDLDRTVPGIRDRLIDSGPALRTHLNVFVDGKRAGLDSPISPGADVYIIPAVSGG
ncbi:MAG: MoaD/ThiS family protein [Chloroflexota bacterium]